VYGIGVLLLVAALPLRAEPDSPQASSEAESQLPVRKLPRDNQLLFLDENGAVQPVRSVDDLAVRREETSRNIQAILGTVPGDEKRCPLDVEVLEENDRGTYVERLITYASEPGGRVPAYLLIPRSALEPGALRHPAVLALHQTSGPAYREVVGVEVTNPNLAYGRELVERGYVVLSPSYPLLSNYQPDLLALGWESGLLKATWDNRRGLDLLDSLPYVKAGTYAAIGHSLGGHNSVFTAFFDERIAVVVSCCGLDALNDYYYGDPAVWQPERGWVQLRYVPKLAQYAGRLEEIPFDYQEIISGLSDRHVLIVAPTRDSNFRADSVDKIAKAAQPVFDLRNRSDQLQIEHPDCEHDFPPEMREKAYQLIDSVLK